MLDVHTIAAGGGSILKFDGHRFQVGPDSAGADPGPACYRRGGPLTITDCNVLLGKLQPRWFPAVFGPSGDQSIDVDVVTTKFLELTASINAQTGRGLSPYDVAAGFLRVAIDNMAHAIKKVSVDKGHDVRDYALNCFGGAGAQHACLVADAVGMQFVIVHRLASVLSAYGMGLTTLSVRREKTLGTTACDSLPAQVEPFFLSMEQDARAELRKFGVHDPSMGIFRKIHLKYLDTEATLDLPYTSIDELKKSFSQLHSRRFGFDTPEKPLVVEYISVEVLENALSEGAAVADSPAQGRPAEPVDFVPLYIGGQQTSIPLYQLHTLESGHVLEGPCIVRDEISTIVVEPHWRARQVGSSHLLLSRAENHRAFAPVSVQADPVMLEIFNNAFMSIAEQMGLTLQHTSRSVNVRERLDFSCAIFDSNGNLIANAPHVPVHLGSMSEAVRSVIRSREGTMQPGDSFMLNDPYQGGTHLPDITVITPVYHAADTAVVFFVASRAHHTDVGGSTPGSMPPGSCHIDEEGILIRNFKLVDRGKFDERGVLGLFRQSAHPARNPVQNVADLKAQVAANEKGIAELRKLVTEYGVPVVVAYVQLLQAYAEEQTRAAICKLSDGVFEVNSDNGSRIAIRVTIDRKSRAALIDFTGTSMQQMSNFNAPRAITNAAVLYVFRTLLDVNIPLNEGCLRPIGLIVPHGSMLDPAFPAAVAAGNVEVSQCITDCLYGALGVLASAQGTMNNLTFGTEVYQHYETICGGAGAGKGFNGASAVHTHMTNTRMTDPEVLESSLPVVLEGFSVLHDSGGRGRWRGGDGTSRRIRFLERMTLSLLANRHSVPPRGLFGGEHGSSGKAWLTRADGTIRLMTSCDTVTVERGDTFVIETPGGGGYGTPDECTTALSLNYVKGVSS
jgi:5-oxoprolinase (ATP-hydrolysing)